MPNERVCMIVTVIFVVYPICTPSSVSCLCIRLDSVYKKISPFSIQFKNTHQRSIKSKVSAAAFNGTQQSTLKFQPKMGNYPMFRRCGRLYIARLVFFTI